MLSRFMHVVAYITISFLLQNNITWIYCVFIYSSVDGYLNCLYPLALMNNDVMDICEQVFEWTYLFTSLEYKAGSGIVGFMVTLCLTVGRTARLFSKVAIPIYSLTNSVRVLYILTNSHYHLTF